MKLLKRPKKSLGQNFLIDQNIIRKIIKIENINNNSTILEIGNKAFCNISIYFLCGLILVNGNKTHFDVFSLLILDSQLMVVLFIVSVCV